MKRIITYVLLGLSVATYAEEVPFDTIATQYDSVEIYGGTLRNARVLSTEKELSTQADTGYLDTLALMHSSLTRHEIKRLTWRPDPMRAVWMSSIVPGYGQIYNQSFWKLPIVYGGYMACVYAIRRNSRQYKEYRQAYRDIYMDGQKGAVDDDPTKSYNAILPPGYDIERMGGTATYQKYLQNWQDRTRRFRDLSIVATVLVYFLSMIDAYVDAQLYDFDISYDLSMDATPSFVPMGHNYELSVAVRF